MAGEGLTQSLVPCLRGCRCDDSKQYCDADKGGWKRKVVKESVSDWTRRAGPSGNVGLKVRLSIPDFSLAISTCSAPCQPQTTTSDPSSNDNVLNPDLWPGQVSRRITAPALVPSTQPRLVGARSLKCVRREPEGRNFFVRLSVTARPGGGPAGRRWLSTTALSGVVGVWSRSSKSAASRPRWQEGLRKTG